VNFERAGRNSINGIIGKRKDLMNKNANKRRGGQNYNKIGETGFKAWI